MLKHFFIKKYLGGPIGILHIKLRSFLEFFKKPFVAPLLFLSFLGFGGGISIALGEKFLPLWARSMGWEYSKISCFYLFLFPQGLKFLWSGIFDEKRYAGFPPGPNVRLLWLILLFPLTGVCIFFMGSGFFLRYFWLSGIFLAFVTVVRSSQNLLIVASQRDMISPKYWGWSETVCILSFQVGERLATGLIFWGLDNHLSWCFLYRFLGLLYVVVFFCRYLLLYEIF